LATLSLKNKRGLSITETILLSVLFHAAFLFYIPSLNLQNTILPMELNIDILINQPEPINKIISKPEPKPIKKIKTKEPLPIKEIIKPEIKVPPIQPEPITPEPITLPQPKKNITPPSVIRKTIESYSAKLTKAISGQKKYPRIAQMRSWQGEIILDLKIDGQGKLIKVKIKKASKFKILDNEGINMVKRASPFPKPPKELESKVFNVLVPISFKLQ
jgi:protein TonB|tara:strand:+ start:230 stop:880 length:651 start_codon:yes stop_codon:yes gene_type:complete